MGRKQTAETLTTITAGGDPTIVNNSINNYFCPQAVNMTTETLTTVISGESSSGTEMTATALISVVSEFISVAQVDFVSVKITSLALTIITAKVATTIN